MPYENPSDELLNTIFFTWYKTREVMRVFNDVQKLNFSLQTDRSKQLAILNKLVEANPFVLSNERGRFDGLDSYIALQLDDWAQIFAQIKTALNYKSYGKDRKYDPKNINLPSKGKELAALDFNDALQSFHQAIRNAHDQIGSSKGVYRQRKFEDKYNAKWSKTINPEKPIEVVITKPVETSITGVGTNPLEPFFHVMEAAGPIRPNLTSVDDILQQSSNFDSAFRPGKMVVPLDYQMKSGYYNALNDWTFYFQQKPNKTPQDLSALAYLKKKFASRFVDTKPDSYDESVALFVAEMRAVGLPNYETQVNEFLHPTNLKPGTTNSDEPSSKHKL